MLTRSALRAALAAATLAAAAPHAFAAEHWCLQPDDQAKSCKVVLTLTPLADNQVELHHLSLIEDDNRAPVKVTVTFVGTREADRYCFRRTPDAAARIDLYWTADVDPLVTAEDRAFPRDRIDRALKRTGLLRSLNGEMVCQTFSGMRAVSIAELRSVTLREP
jgi:hypothetical protein